MTMASEISTQALYDQSAAKWSRSQQLLLSDFTARPRLIEAAGAITGLHLWDLGCGEGYVGRELARRGPERIEGFDLSGAMVEAAQRQAGPLAAAEGGPLHYRKADLTDPAQYPQGPCDGAVAVFLFNYLSQDAMVRLLRHCREAIRPGGFFLFCVPHPALAFLRHQEPPFFLDPGPHAYLNSRDALFEGRIWRRDGVSNPVRSIHRTVADYFEAFRAGGWDRLPLVEELGVRPEDLALDPAFFGPLTGTPLHLLFRLER
jgi:SAM-dependent methyltransferase